MAENISKILVLNPLPSKIESVLKKSNQINKSNGPFDCTFLIGDSFIESIEVPSINVNCKTYFFEGINDVLSMDNPKSSMKDKKNLSYMGRYGITETENGLKIGFISGKLKKENDYVKSEVTSMFSDVKLDILISYFWPQAYAKTNSDIADKVVDEIIAKTEPRYVFSCGKENGTYFESNPFQWKHTSRVSRFIGLGEYKTKEKWFYAFNISKEQSNTETPDNLVDNPFDRNDRLLPQGKKRALEEGIQENDDKKIIEKKRKVINPDNCFFCLGNPKVEAHMVISVGSSCYLAAAKGPLTKPHKFKNKPISGHTIIIPINHISSVPPLLRFGNDKGDEIILDMEKFGDSLQKFYATSFEMGICKFEINTLNSVHYHQQVIPINLFLSINRFQKHLKHWEEKNNKKNDNDSKSLLNFHLLKKEATGYDQQVMESLFNEDKKEYISIELTINNLDDNKAEGTYLFISVVDSSKYIDLQFLRKVVANFLNLRERVYWNKCIQSTELETLETEAFRNLYAPFDFTCQ
ncbi:Drn1 protein [Saccharomycopsis crataegensis]|uniref:Drn1 protein n=1 Tax=Saccharomycopsis crataegensis TaxID=43959 RepID=A0AAV5QGU8_9ASCO|nr:Drn1 protein [Saccharomycopsis crataegensis]